MASGPVVVDLSGDESTDRWLSARVINLIVGPEQKKWAVHEKILVEHSTFFAEYFQSEDGRGRDELNLPHEDPKLFALLVRWLYGIAFMSGGRRAFRFPVPDGKETTVRDFLRLYVLGGRYGIIGVRNAAIDALYSYYGEAKGNHEAPNLHDVKYIFDNTAPEAPIRLFLIAHALFYLFSWGRENSPLPDDWAQVLKGDGEIGFAMIRMLSEWDWVSGKNAPVMTIKPRHKFHEHPPTPDIVKKEVDEGNILEL